MQNTLIELSTYLVDALVPEELTDLDLKRQHLVALLLDDQVERFLRELLAQS